MFRTMLAGVAAIALMSGAAYAQDSYSSQTTTIAPAAPVAPDTSFHKSTTIRHTDAFGNQAEEHDSVSKSQALTPDGDTTSVTHTHSSTNNEDQ